MHRRSSLRTLQVRAAKLEFDCTFDVFSNGFLGQRPALCLGFVRTQVWRAVRGVKGLRGTGSRRPSAARFLILIGLKLTAVNVVLVDLDVGLPLLRQIIHRENGRHWTDR